MPAGSPQRDGSGWFIAPCQVNQRRYEALRAFFVDGLTYAEAGERFGYTRWAMVNLVREHRAGRLELFAAPKKPGPPAGSAPAKDRARGRVIELRRQGLSTCEISARLATEGRPLNRTGVGEILAEEGSGRLIRHPGPEAGISAATPGRDLDFHAVMHWGADPALEKHDVPKRSQRARSVLTFFAQDSGTHNLVYATAGISKATQAREAIAFCDHWKQVTGHDPAMLVMDQKVTTQPVLGELDARGVKFLTLRMRSPALTRHINALRPGDFKTVTLDRAGHFGQPAHPRVCEDPAATLSAYPGTVRQLIVTGLGRDTPTVIITNDRDTTTRNLIRQYARRMTIEQRLAEIIRAFCVGALSSTVNLNVDLDIMLAVLAQALTAALRARLPGYAAVTPDVIQRRFLETPGQIITTTDTITVRLERRAYSPVLRKATLPATTRIPWLGNRAIHYDLS